MQFLKSISTSGIILLLITMFLTACASNISNIKIYSISTDSHKLLKKLTLVGVGNCRDGSVRIRFIDNKIISNSHYSAVAIKPGVHKFTVDLDDEKLNNKDLVQRFYIEWKRVIRNIDLEAGKFYLVCPVQKKNKDWTFWLEERKFEFDYYYKYRDNIDYV